MKKLENKRNIEEEQNFDIDINPTKNSNVNEVGQIDGNKYKTLKIVNALFFVKNIIYQIGFL